MPIFHSVREVATAILSFLVLAVVGSLISANVRTFASKRGLDSYIDRLTEHPRVAATVGAVRRVISGWQPLRKRWWLWLALGLSGGFTTALWVMPSLQSELSNAQIASSKYQAPIKWNSRTGKDPLLVLDTYNDNGVTWVRSLKVSGYATESTLRKCGAKLMSQRTATQFDMKVDQQSIAPGDKLVVSYDLPSPIPINDFIRELEAIRLFGWCEVGFGGATYFDGFYSHSDLEKLIAEFDNRNSK